MIFSLILNSGLEDIFKKILYIDKLLFMKDL